MDPTGQCAETDGSLKRPEKRQTGNRAAAQPPMTPMIDVVFQLLLFFMLGCQFVVPEGQLQANLPTIGRGPDPATKVYLRPSGVNNSGVLAEVPDLGLTTPGMPQLHDRLKGLLQQPGMEALGVRIIPAGPVRWQHVVDAFNQASRAGCTRVTLVDSDRGR